MAISNTTIGFPDDELTDLRVPIAPRGAANESGPFGRTWGFADLGGGRWQVSPSIDFDPEWHETPTVVGVPSGELWQ